MTFSHDFVISCGGCAARHRLTRQHATNSDLVAEGLVVLVQPQDQDRGFPHKQPVTRLETRRRQEGITLLPNVAS